MRRDTDARWINALLVEDKVRPGVNASQIRTTFLDLLECAEKLKAEGGLRWARILKGLSAQLRKQTREFEQRVKKREGNVRQEVQDGLRKHQHTRTG